MELGSGALSPEWYYTLMHNSYKRGAKNATSVKNTLRLAASTASLPQVEYADTIQADLESRAKIEAMNIADREVDVAWLTEGSKIEGKLQAFKTNVSFLTGRTSRQEIEAWTELSSMYDFAIKTTKKAYMPNSERQKQYLAIYDEIVASNDRELWYMIDSSFITTLPDTWGINQRFIMLPINHWNCEYQRVFLGGLTCDSEDYYNADSHANAIFLPKLQKDEPLYIGFFHTGAYQESIGGYGGIQHCLIPAPGYASLPV